MNFILGVGFTVILALMLVFNIRNSIAIKIIQYIISINFVLMVFNLLPIGPLDGTGIIRAILWKDSYKFDSFMARYGTIILLMLLITGVIGMFISGIVTVIQTNVYNLVFMIFGIS